MARRLILVAALCVVATLAAGCGGGYSGKKKESSGGGSKTTVAGVEANNHGTMQVSDEVEVELDDTYFKPTVLKGKPGAQVKLELKNEGSKEHSFTIDSQSIDKDLEGGEDAKVTVTIPRSGQVSFYCKYHKSLGMAGALEAAGTASGSGTTTGETTTVSKY